MADIQTVAETQSTNDDVAALARKGAPEGTWIRAERQTRGRGRQGRDWLSPAGNLYASTLVRLRSADPPAPTLALLASVALHEVVATVLRHPGEGRDLRTRSHGGSPRDSDLRRDDVIIKWPNDLLVDGAKLAGILLEREGDAVVIGFGVNLSHHPEALDRSAISLAALTGTASDPGPFLEMLTESVARWLTRWRREGVAPVRARWLAAAHPTGTALSTAQGEGLFDGLDENGALRLRLADGRTRVIHAGDVFLL